MNLDELFKKIDKSGDGQLDVKEFTFLINIIDPTADNFTVNVIFEKIDDDRSGFVTLKEFKSMLLEKDYSYDYKIHPII